MANLFVAALVIIALVGSALVARRRIAWVYVTLLPLCNQHLGTSVGTVAIHPSDLVTVSVFMVLLVRHWPFRKHRWTWRDVLLILIPACYALSVAVNGNSAGQVFQSWARWSMWWVLPYLIARLSIRNLQEWVDVRVPMLVLGMVLSVFAVVEAFSGKNLYHMVGLLGGSYPGMKFGLHRAHVCISHPILFGLHMATLLPLALGLLKYPGRRGFLGRIAVPFILAGVIASTGATAYMYVIFLFGFLMVFPIRRYWPVVLACVVGGIVFVEIYSNRHFYEVISGYSGSAGTAYYRIQMTERVIEVMPGRWVLGYGNTPLPLHDYWDDVCSQFIFLLATCGLLGLSVFVLFFFGVLWSVRTGYTRMRTISNKFLFWCAGGHFAGMIPTLFTVAAFGQTVCLLAFLYGYYENVSSLGYARVPSRTLESESPRRAFAQAGIPAHENEGGCPRATPKQRL